MNPIVPGDYKLLVSPKCGRSFREAVASLGTDRAKDFHAGLNEFVGEFSQGEKPEEAEPVEEPDVYRMVVAGYLVHLQIDNWRWVARIIRLRRYHQEAVQAGT